ncbi:MAG TPA: hypothetical protein VNZ52_08165, partial [Candidatus Thermoplasmatota archaeon]|nr:hypothetical protein [Candidatus Thermoplasmatota archaeon]
FTGLWALTWLGAQAMNPSTAIQGGFAVGGVMASSGLTALWWKTRMTVALGEESEAQEEADKADQEETATRAG